MNKSNNKIIISDPAWWSYIISFISDESCGIPHLKLHNQLPNDANDVAYLLLDQLDCDKKKKIRNNKGNAKRGVSPCLKFDPVTLTFDLL